jgi:hypothetical protein
VQAASNSCLIDVVAPVVHRGGACGPTGATNTLDVLLPYQSFAHGSPVRLLRQTQEPSAASFFRRTSSASDGVSG